MRGILIKLCAYFVKENFLFYERKIKLWKFTLDRIETQDVKKKKNQFPEKNLAILLFSYTKLHWAVSVRPLMNGLLGQW